MKNGDVIAENLERIKRDNRDFYDSAYKLIREQLAVIEKLSTQVEVLTKVVVHNSNLLNKINQSEKITAGVEPSELLDRNQNHPKLTPVNDTAQSFYDEEKHPKLK